MCLELTNLQQKSFWSGSPSEKKKKNREKQFMIVEEKVLEVLHYMEFVFLGELACHKLQNEIPNLPKNHGELSSLEIAGSYFFCI